MNQFLACAFSFALAFVQTTAGGKAIVGGKAVIGSAGITLVGHIKAACSSSPCTTAGLTTTGATLLVAVSDGFSAQTTVTDSLSNTWQTLTAFNHMKINYVFNPTVGAGQTFTGTGGGGTPTIFVTAWSGTLRTASVFDTQNGNGASGSTTSCQTGPVVPSQPGELIIASEGTSGNNPFVYTVDSGFTLTDTVTNGSTFEGGAAAFLITNGAINPVNPTFTNGIASNTPNCNVATFKHP